MWRAFTIACLALFLSACSTYRPASGCYNGINNSLTHETWRQHVSTNISQWKCKGSRWFQTGDPDLVNEINNKTPYSAAQSTMKVKVPNFTNIEVNGAFTVQLFGGIDENSVFVYGPNDEVRQVDVQVSGNTLSLKQLKKSRCGVKHVIIRIGVRNLMHLTQQGSGRIEGRQLQSTGLTLCATGAGDTLLSGNLNVRSIRQSGFGSVMIIGANTPQLDITAVGAGEINVGGNVGVHVINHSGINNINILGANTDGLTINARGRGKIAIDGWVNLKELKARQNVQVYIYTVNSGTLYVYGFDQAQIGLGGAVNDLYVETLGNSIFWGRYLIAQNAYARAHNSSHININSDKKVFAAATGNASVYFFGSPTIMSQFVSGNGVIIPIWNNDPRSYVGYVTYKRRQYK